MKQINIIYSKENNIEYSMWLYFFESCGVWVKPKTILQYSNNNEDDTFVSQEDEPYLFLLSENDLKLIKKRETTHIVYLIPKLVLSEYIDRKDIFSSYFDIKDLRSILLRLDKFEDSVCLTKIFDLFLKHRLWGCTWLFREINNEPESELSIKINNTCTEMYPELCQQIQSIGINRYNSYMKIYFQYIMMAVQNADKRTRDKQVTQLMKQISEHVRIFGGSSSLYYLAGQICRLCPGEYKTILFYYLNIGEEDRTALLLYKIGLEYQYRHNDIKKAWLFYKKSYMVDKNYRSLYKHALNCDNEGNWQTALNDYQNILNEIQNERIYDSISILGIEYECRATIRIALIYKNIIKEKYKMDSENAHLKDIFDEITNCSDFDTMLKYMFAENWLEIRDLLLVEIKRKIKMLLFQNFPDKILKDMFL